MTFIEKEEHKRKRAEASMYRKGEPLTGLIRVARNADSHAMAVAIPEFDLVMIHYVVAPMGLPDEQYLPVRPNHYLVWSLEADYLYTMRESDFNRMYELDPNPGEGNA